MATETRGKGRWDLGKCRTRAAAVLGILFFAGTYGGILTGCADAFAPIPEPEDFLDRLNAIPGVTAREYSPTLGFGRAFELDIVQPRDHQDPEGPTFIQRAYLTHTGDQDPMIFAPGGYATFWSSGQELAHLLHTNLLNVTHRFFLDSEPHPLDWQYLTVRQSVEDHHRIVTLLKEIYTAPWISTGASKSGETVLFHRRFYPDDVDATVAYVAPLLFSAADPRFQPFLDAIGKTEDREAIHSFQRRLLLARDSLLGRFQAWFPANGYTLSLPAGPVFEGEVLSYEWAFWQYRNAEIEDIPGPDASYDEMMENLALVSGISGSSDRMRYFFRPYVYQAFTEIGYPARDFSYLEDLLVFEPLTLEEEYGFPPGLSFAYRPETIPDVLQWIQTQGNNIVLIYGGADPWTGGAIEIPGLTNALKITKEGASHRVRIADLSERDQVLARLGSWVGLDLLGRASWPGPAASAEADTEAPALNQVEDLFLLRWARGFRR